MRNRDPPYEITRGNKRGTKVLHYKFNDVPLQEVVDTARHLKGSVAISYSDLPQTRKALCVRPFRCKKITKWALAGNPYTELLAVKVRR